MDSSEDEPIPHEDLPELTFDEPEKEGDDPSNPLEPEFSNVSSSDEDEVNKEVKTQE